MTVKVCMNTPIAKLTKHNHQKHIIEVMPFIAAVFGVQCYLMTQFTNGADIGNLALTMASALIGFVLSLYLYDEKHHVVVFEDKIVYGFLGLGQSTTVLFKDIERVTAPEDERKFSSLMIKLKDGSCRALYFIDYPLASKDFLSAQLTKAERDESSEDQDLAA